MNTQSLSFGAFIRNSTLHLPILRPSADHIMHTMPYEKAVPNHACMRYPRLRVFSHFSRTFANCLAEGFKIPVLFSSENQRKGRAGISEQGFSVVTYIINIYELITDNLNLLFTELIYLA